MTREFLLKASIAEFNDKVHKVLLVPFKRIFTKEGYSYLILDRLKSREVESAIHFGREYAVTEDIGRLHTTQVEFSTREKIDIPNTLFIYKNMDTGKAKVKSKKCDLELDGDDMVIFCKGFNGYNETMKQFMYEAEVLTADKLMMLKPFDDVLGYSSFDIISQMPDYDILPRYAFIEDKINDGVVLLNIEETTPISLPIFDRANKRYVQSNYEDISFDLLNLDRLKIAKFADKLQQYSLDSNRFGVCSDIKIAELGNLQESAALRGPAVKISLKVSYAIDIAEVQKFEKYIRDVVWRCDDAVFNTFNKL